MLAEKRMITFCLWKINWSKAANHLKLLHLQAFQSGQFLYLLSSTAQKSYETSKNSVTIGLNLFSNFSKDNNRLQRRWWCFSPAHHQFQLYPYALQNLDESWLPGIQRTKHYYFFFVGNIDTIRLLGVDWVWVMINYRGESEKSNIVNDRTKVIK